MSARESREEVIKMGNKDVGKGLYDRARQMAPENTGLRWHSFVYVVVNSLLFVVWLIVLIGTGGKVRFPWFAFPAAGWGSGLAIHAFAVQRFDHDEGHGGDWRSAPV